MIYLSWVGLDEKLNQLVAAGCGCCGYEVDITPELLDEAEKEFTAFLDKIRELKAKISS